MVAILPHQHDLLGQEGLRRLASAIGIVVVAVLAGLAVAGVDEVPTLSLTVGALIVALALGAPRRVVLFTLCALPFLGAFRRLTGSYLQTTDPLLLLPPVIAVVCLLASPSRGTRPPATPLSKVVVVFLALGTIEILNPLQGGLQVGIVGAGLFVGPMVWFFVGRRFGDDNLMRRSQLALSIIAVVVVAYGTKQLLSGVFGFEQPWVDSRVGTYSALTIAGHVRPFSTFSSAAEYSYFLVLGAALFAARLRTLGWLLFSVPVVLFAVACFFAGSRGIFLACCCAVLLVAIANRTRRWRTAVALCLVLSVLGLALVRFVPLASDDTVSAAIRNRTVQGLARPFDRQVSTLGIHVDLFVNGFEQALHNPLGIGAGVTNRAGALFGDVSLSSEHDLPNVLIAYGWLGGILLLMLVVHVYRLARRAAELGRADLLGPAVFVLVLFGTWFVGGLYAVSAILWFFLGSVDRLLATARVTPQAEPVPEVEPATG